MRGWTPHEPGPSPRGLRGSHRALRGRGTGLLRAHPRDRGSARRGGVGVPSTTGRGCALEGGGGLLRSGQSNAVRRGASKSGNPDGGVLGPGVLPPAVSVVGSRARHLARSGRPFVEEFSAADRAVFYRVIERRRDVRAFRPDPIPSETLYRILGAAHHAPSVGLMQPWNFIVIQDADTKARVKEIFLEENEKAAAHYSGPRASLYRSLKLEGIQEAPVNLCVTADRTR